MDLATSARQGGRIPIEYVVPEGPEQWSGKGLIAMAEAARLRLNAWEAYSIRVDE
jgi:hypothetical protein